MSWLRFGKKKKDKDKGKHDKAAPELSAQDFSKTVLIRSQTHADPPEPPKLSAVYSAPPNQEVLEGHLIGGSDIEHFTPSRRPTKGHIIFSPSTFYISYFEGSRQALQIHLLDVLEIRKGAQALQSKDFRLAQGDPASLPNAAERAFVILHGKEFRLKMFCALAPSQEIATAWVDALWIKSRFVSPQLYQSHLLRQRYIDASWQELVGDRQTIALREVKLFATKANKKMPIRELKDLFNIVVEPERQTIGKLQLEMLYWLLVEQQPVEEFFGQFSSAGSKTRLTVEDLQRFFAREQGEDVSIEACKQIISDFGESDESLKINRFVEYLHSEANHVWNKSHDMVYQDLHYPMACYFIASSHNTYLMGDQWRSESSVEAYIRCLRDGCRCLEIDCWDGSAGDVVVYHGHTLTSKIKFRDVLVAIQEHAFDASDLPLILSIENHTSLPQQEYMAREFVNVFGPRLVTTKLKECSEPDRNCMPSPAQLKNKIIIKHKKLEGTADFVESTHKMDNDLSFSVKNGCLFMQDPVDMSWNKHYFVLTAQKLFYAEADDEDDEDEFVDDMGDVKGALKEELHFSEPWYHGHLEGGRLKAEELLREYMHEQGTFLVRSSDSFPGEYSLSFTFNNRAQHCRIRKHADGSFYLTEPFHFMSLYELIEYYRRVNLRAKEFALVLDQAVPQVENYEGKRWYHPDLTRDQAEDMLRRIRYDGAYLVRVSGHDSNFWSISFRAEGKIKHCRIRKEGRAYCIGDAEFDSLSSLVRHYEKKPLYRKMKLKYAVDEEFLRQHDVGLEEDIYNSDDLYQEPNAFAAKAKEAKTSNCTCRALYGYSAQQDDELSFPKGAMITNVVKTDAGGDGGDWWQGSYGTQVNKYFPSNYVEEIDHSALVNEDKDDSENMLGSLEKDFLAVHDILVREDQRPEGDQQYVFQILDRTHQKSNLLVAADSEEERRDWIKFLTDVVKETVASQQHTGNKKVKIHPDLSNLVCYSQSVAFVSFEQSRQTEYWKMSSFPEKKALPMARPDNALAASFNEYNIRQFSRVYPNGKRVDSSNYHPQQLWNCGAQLVALNYQTPDRPMWVNHGKFQQNGRSGYILKPLPMLQPSFDPYNCKSYGVEPVNVRIKVISGRHLVKPSRGVASPFVEIELVGIDRDKYKTQVIADNGLAPVWMERGERINEGEVCEFAVDMPELACLQFVVQDEDVFGDANVIGQNVYPLGSASEPSIRTGFRSIQLKNAHNEPLELSSLLVHISVEVNRSEEYQSLQQLREQLRLQEARREELVRQQLRDPSDTGQKQQLQDLNVKIGGLEQEIMHNPAEQKRAQGKGKKHSKP
eukprot:m.357987 g.357987  ORF g.357987 m.357987 type:complete len:1324 (-) comp18011_c0_seq1:571-4542(-)